MPFHIQFEYIPGQDNIVSDTLSRYPAASLMIASISLIVPQALGMLTRISIAAQDDDKYQELLNKVEATMTVDEVDPLRLFFNNLALTPSSSENHTPTDSTNEPSIESSTHEQASTPTSSPNSSPDKQNVTS